MVATFEALVIVSNRRIWQNIPFNIIQHTHNGARQSPKMESIHVPIDEASISEKVLRQREAY